VAVARDPMFSSEGAWWYGLTQRSDTRFGAAMERCVLILQSTMVKLISEADDIWGPSKWHSLSSRISKEGH
jgi:hypothetical protein